MKSFKKKTKARWREIVDAWKDSGMTVSAFCRQHGVADGRFYEWRKRFGCGQQEDSLITQAAPLSKQRAVKFLPVQVKDIAAPAAGKSTTSQRLEIFLGNGAVVRLSGDLSEETVSALMKLSVGAIC